jgi:hypothetical protein
MHTSNVNTGCAKVYACIYAYVHTYIHIHMQVPQENIPEADAKRVAEQLIAAFEKASCLPKGSVKPVWSRVQLSVPLKALESLLIPLSHRGAWSIFFAL